MSRSFTLTDLPALDDLQTFLARAARIEDGSVRLVAANGVLAVYVAIFYPVGLTDDAPTVLGLRVARISSDDTFDAVVPLAALRQRLENVQADAARAATGSGVSLMRPCSDGESTVAGQIALQRTPWLR